MLEFMNDTDTYCTFLSLKNRNENIMSEMVNNQNEYHMEVKILTNFSFYSVLMFSWIGSWEA